MVGRGATIVSVLGFVGALLLAALVTPWIRLTLRRAVVIQETFDSELFGLPWNEGLAGQRVPTAEVHALSRALRSGGKRERYILAGWYDDTGNIASPMDVLVCQEQNLGWDLRLRGRYAIFLGSAAAVWLTLGIGLGFGRHLPADRLLLSWFIPSLPALVLALELMVNQIEIYSEKKRLLGALVRVVGAQTNGTVDAARRVELWHFARHIQDGLFATRVLGPRVPHFLYHLFRSKDEEDYQVQTIARQAAAVDTRGTS